jgi:hypothetical protein
MKDELEQLLGSLHRGTQTTPGTNGSSGLGTSVEDTVTQRVVHHQDGTTSVNPSLTPINVSPYSDIDGLFGDKPGYQSIKSEKPEHRLMLWLKLQGHNAKEIATITGYTPEHVRTVCKQPWFREAFCRISTEQGQDAVQTFLEGHVVEACEGLVDLGQHASTDSVKLSAWSTILDRVRGKPAVKIETKNASTVDVTVTTVADLLSESQRLSKELAARGAFQHSTS